LSSTVVKNKEIIDSIFNSDNTFFTKKEKIKLLKSDAPHPDEKNKLAHLIFQNKFNSFIKFISNIVLVISKKGEVLDRKIYDSNLSNTNIFEPGNSISELITNETSCEFFAKVNQAIVKGKEFSSQFKHQELIFEVIICPYDIDKCILYVVDLDETEDSKNNIGSLNKLITEKERLEKTNKKLISRNRDLIDSINYAQKIQRAIFPEPSSFQKIFKDSFIHFNPKDIVSGDMYWFAQYEDTIVLAVVDCTGHGVPGAFIAVLAYSLLNKILNETNVKFKQPSELLSDLHFELTNILNYEKSALEVKDGMDIGLCLINKEHNILLFSGAFHNLYHVSNGHLNTIKGDKLTVGGGNYGKKNIFRFNTTMINYHETDSFYLTTDGYLDQFGGERDKKFLNKRFRSMIEENHDKHMIDQKLVFTEQFDLWRGENEQVDDILVVGFKCIF
jgi:serine phosphatase RsbU (regulator of sigma subunit)